MHSDDIRRIELLKELPLVLAAVQRLGQGLVNTSHGAMYHHASEFNDLLHLARVKLDELQESSDDVLEETLPQEMQAPMTGVPRFI